MRDFERLEELSSTVRSGLEATSVVWAIDQALEGKPLDRDLLFALAAGSEMLRAIADPNAARTEPEFPLAQNMLGGDNVRSVRSMIVEAGLSEDEGNPRQTFEDLANALNAVNEGKPAKSVQAELERALELFAVVGAIRLGQAGGVSRSGRERSSWLPKMTISPLS